MTFVDAAQTRHKRDPGRCFVRAGFIRLKDRTGAGLVVLQMLPADMPELEMARGEVRSANLRVVERALREAKRAFHGVQDPLTPLAEAIDMMALRP